MFDPDNPNAGWVTVAQMNFRRSLVHLAVLDNLIYAIGGMENGGYTSIVEVYDPVNQTWTEVCLFLCLHINSQKHESTLLHTRIIHKEID